MLMEGLLEFLWGAAKAAVPPAALVLIIGWICRTWIGERLKASVKHEYDDRLEQLKAELKAQGDSNLALLKSEIDRQGEKLRIAASSFSEVQKATIARKVDAVDALWNGFVQMRDAFPGVYSITDIFSDREMRGFYTSPTMNKFSKDVGAFTEMDLIGVGFAEVEAVRPHLGEYAWAIYVTYRTIMGRSMHLIKNGRSDPSGLEWYKDQNIQNLVASAFGLAKMEEFANLGHSRFNWINNNFSTILLAAIDTILTGQTFSDAAYKQAERMEQQISVANKAGKTINP
jgi:hypothetical protein